MEVKNKEVKYNGLVYKLKKTSEGYNLHIESKRRDLKSLKSDDLKIVLRKFGFENKPLTNVKLTIAKEIFYIEDNCFNYSNVPNLLLNEVCFKCYTELGLSAFENQVLLKKVNWDTSKDSKEAYKISNSCFKDCHDLKSIEIPMPYVDSHAFENCISLEKISFKKENVENPYFGVSAFASSGLKRLIIPRGTKTINQFCFSNCKDLERIYFPDTIEIIRNHAFSNCNNLLLSSLPYSLKELGNFAFFNVDVDKEFSLPLYLETIGTSAIVEKEKKYYDEKKITIPDTINQAKKESIQLKNIKEIYIKGNIHEEIIRIIELSNNNKSEKLRIICDDINMLINTMNVVLEIDGSITNDQVKFVLRSNNKDEVIPYTRNIIQEKSIEEKIEDVIKDLENDIPLHIALRNNNLIPNNSFHMLETSNEIKTHEIYHLGNDLYMIEPPINDKTIYNQEELSQLTDDENMKIPESVKKYIFK